MPHVPSKISQPLSYTSYYVRKRKTKRIFLKQISQLINREALTHVLRSITLEGSQGKEKKPTQR